MTFRALPVTQHVRIWEVYIRFLKRHDIVESAVRCFRRFVKLSPECIEDFINYLIKNNRLDEAAKVMHFLTMSSLVKKFVDKTHEFQIIKK